MWVRGAHDQDSRARAWRREGTGNVEVTLRDVRDSDLPVFWAQMTDERAQHMAAVTRGYFAITSRGRILAQARGEEINEVTLTLVSARRWTTRRRHAQTTPTTAHP
jgi:restriction endonuclease Mrr